MNASLPPSSSTTFFRCPPATLAIAAPTSLEPVTQIAATRGSATTSGTVAGGISMVRKSPTGNPALTTASSMASAHAGTLDACLRTTAFPAANAGASNLMTCQKGKFQGMTASTIPSGSYWMYDSSKDVGTTVGCRNSPA